jgi:hypothetical protein
MQGVISLRGNNCIDTSTVNTLTQMDAITYVDTGHRVKLSEGVVWMNADAGALDAADALVVSDIEVTWERPIDAPVIAGGLFIDLPKEPGFPKITVKIKIPHADATNLAYLATFLAGTPQKMTITFTGALIETSHYYQLTLGFPRLLLQEPPQAPLEDIISNTLTFEAQEAAAAPTGMPAGAVRPYILLENLATADYLV